MKHYFKNFNTLEYLLISLLITVTLFIFGPIELYYTNIDEFFFGITSIAVWLCLFCVISTVLLTLLQSFVRPQKVSNLISAVLFAIGIGSYLQGNYLNADYGVFNGAAIEWENYKIYGLCNTGIWIAIIAASVFLSIKLKKDTVQKIHGYVCGFIIAIEMITLAVLLITAKKTTDIVVTNNEQFTVGDEENIIILLLDTFDAAVFDEMLYGEQGGKIEQQFRDFTYYDNMVGAYPYTLYSVGLILSGEWSDRTTSYTQYAKTAYENSDLFPELVQQGYSIGLYTSSTTIRGGDDLARCSRNLYGGKEKVSSANGAALEFLQLTAFRYLPHELKRYAPYETASFEKYHRDNNYKMNDIEFYKKLQNEGIKVTDGKSFIFYHLKGIHAPYTMDENANAIEDATEESQAWGELKIVGNYIKQLKEKGVYDNSTIIVMADHGYKGLGQNPIFMVKENAAQHAFSVNSSPLSFDDLKGTYSYWLTGDSKNQTTIYDFKEGDDRVRYFRWCALEDQTKYSVPFVEYAIYGDAGDMSSIQKTGNLYGWDGIYQQEKIKLNSELKISFQEGGNYEDIINTGYRQFGGYIYSYGEYTDFILDTTEYEGNDLKLAVSIANVITSPQRLQLYVNDNYIDELEADENGDILTYIIPKDYLSQDSMKIKFVYPDMVTGSTKPVEGHTADGLAIVYDYIRLSQLDELKKGIAYTFGINGNADNIIRNGLCDAEQGMQWSYGTESNFWWTSTGQKEDIIIDITFKTVIDDNQILKFYMNDNFIQESMGDELHARLNIPSKFLVNGMNDLKIIYPNAISPKELTDSEDDRPLSVAFEKIAIQ